MPVFTDQIQSLLEAARKECGLPQGKPRTIPAEDVEKIGEACGSDEIRLRRCLKRRLLGDPVAYILGYQDFRGHRYKVDRRTYITDTETVYLVEEVTKRARKLHRQEKRRVVILEIGAGCGCLSISIKHALGDAVEVAAVDIDPDSLEVARENVSRHQVDVDLYESDLLQSLPDAISPDIVFGDPPWGNETTVYDESRPTEHYLAMPSIAVFPPGGPTAMHEQIVTAVGRRGWRSEILLNAGVLMEGDLIRLQGVTESMEVIHPTPDLSILCCRTTAAAL